MLTFRPLHAIRTLVLGTAATLVLCVPAIVLAQSAAPAPAAAKSTTAPTAAKSTTATKKHHSAAEEQTEMNEHLQKMKEHLKLTDDQVVKVREIMQSKMSEMSELSAKYKGQPSTPETKAAMEKAHKELHADFESKLAGVLSAEQMTEYKKMSAEHKKESAKEEKAEEAKK